MRDPDRIDKILDDIRSAWKARPDLRLMQLLLNIRTGYYMEDNELQRRLHEFYPDTKARNCMRILKVTPLRDLSKEWVICQNCEKVFQGDNYMEWLQKEGYNWPICTWCGSSDVSGPVSWNDLEEELENVYP